MKFQRAHLKFHKKLSTHTSQNMHYAIYRHTATVRDKCSLKTKSTVSNIRIFYDERIVQRASKVIPQQYRGVKVHRNIKTHVLRNKSRAPTAIRCKTAHGIWLQNPRFTIQVHSPHVLQRPWHTIYNLNWNQKQAGLTKSKHSIALSKAASYHKANHWS